MEDPRSRSYADGRMEMESSYASPGLHTRSYSASCAASRGSASQDPPKELNKLRKGKSTSGSSSSSSKGVIWSLGDPELQRKKRVAGYKVYDVEGKMKGSFRKSFRWIKDKYTQVVYGRF